MWQKIGLAFPQESAQATEVGGLTSTNVLTKRRASFMLKAAEHYGGFGGVH